MISEDNMVEVRITAPFKRRFKAKSDQTDVAVEDIEDAVRQSLEE